MWIYILKGEDTLGNIIPKVKTDINRRKKPLY